MAEGCTVQSLAREASGWFEFAERVDGDPDSRYVRTRDGRPDWVQDLCFEAHGEFLPDDWRYSTIWAALGAIVDAEDPWDASGEFADGEVDVYTSARLAWLSSNLARVGYVDEAASEFGGSASADVVESIGLGQYAEASEVYGLVLQFLEARVDELESADSEEVAS